MDKALILGVPKGMSPPSLHQLAYGALADLLRVCYGVVDMPYIAKDINGKPWFPERPDLHFSVSHCRSALMVAVSAHPVGCDVEDIVSQSEIDDLLGVAFNRDERKAISEAADPCRELTLTWTRKEAIVKRLGCIPGDPRSWPSGLSVASGIFLTSGFTDSCAWTFAATTPTPEILFRIP